MFRIFYDKTVVLNRKRLHFKNACIAVSNHPSTLTDPLHVANKIRKQVFFLANAGLFKSKFGGWFFNTFYCIPVERPQDVNGRRIQNDEAFVRCDEHLSKDGCLYIAPQGSSKMVRRLGYEIKTGTARIALSAESKNDFKLGLTILPVGLNYSSPTEFRSNILINAGEHIQVSDYQRAYTENPKQAVRQLTSDLEDQMRTLVLDTEDEEEELLVIRMEALLNGKQPLPLEDNFYRTQKLIKSLHQLKKTQPGRYDDLATAIHQHFEQLDQWGITPATLSRKTNLLLHTLGLIVGFPVFLYGWVNHFFANFIPALAAKKLNLYIGYTSAVKIMLGLFTYPIFYGLQIWLVHRYFAESWITTIYALSLPAVGLLAWAYAKSFRKWKLSLKWQKLKKEQPAPVNSSLEAQHTLLDQIDQLLHHSF